jgi:excisionase family DNA binding protein
MSISIDDWKTRQEAAAFLDLKPQTLAVWASTGRYGLPFYKCGRKVRYRQSDLDAFIERRRVTSTGEVESL